jgi:hypothetical protein
MPSSQLSTSERARKKKGRKRGNSAFIHARAVFWHGSIGSKPSPMASHREPGPQLLLQWPLADTMTPDGDQPSSSRIIIVGGWTALTELHCLLTSTATAWLALPGPDPGPYPYLTHALTLFLLGWSACARCSSVRMPQIRRGHK